MIVDKPLFIRELLAEEDEAERAIAIINTIVDLVQSNTGQRFGLNLRRLGKRENNLP